MIHFVYQINNRVNGHYYIGKHSTQDLNDGYMGSGTALFRAFNKYGMQSFYREVLKFFPSSEEAFAYEAELVTEELVKSPRCYNIALGGIGGYLAPGTVTVYNPNEEERRYFQVPRDDERYLSGELVQCTKGTVMVRENARIFRVGLDDPRYLSGELRPYNEGYWDGRISVRDKLGNYLMVFPRDPRVLSGELVGVTRGMIQIVESADKYGPIALVDKHCEETRAKLSSGEWLHWARATQQYRDAQGGCVRTFPDDPRVLNGSLIPIFQGMFAARNKQGKVFHVSRNDPRVRSGELVSIHRGTMMVRDKATGKSRRMPCGDLDETRYEKFFKGETAHRDQSGCIHMVPSSDPRVQSGELVSVFKGTHPARDVSTGRPLGRVDLSDPRWQSGEIESMLKGRPVDQVTCPHCGKTGRTSNMYRWHFDHCKQLGRNDCATCFWRGHPECVDKKGCQKYWKPFRRTVSNPVGLDWKGNIVTQPQN